MQDHTTNPQDVPTRQCPQCRKLLSLTSEYFTKDAGTILGFRYACKECDKKTRALNREKRAEYYQKYSKENKDKIREKHRKYYAENKDKISEKIKKYYEENPDKNKERHKKYIASHADHRRDYEKKYRANNREKLRASGREHYEANKKRIAGYHKEHYKATNGASQKKYSAANKEKNRERNKKYTAANPEKGRVNVERRLARKRALPDTLTNAQWTSALDYWGGCCVYCGRPAGLFHAIAMDHFIPLSSLDCPGTIALNCLPACHYIDGCNSSKGSKDPYLWLDQKFGEREAKKILKKIDDYFEWVKGQ